MRFGSLLSFLLGLLILSPGARAAVLAPSFSLPRLDGAETLASDSLFQQSRTYLVFYWSRCPRCLESLRGCESFYRERRSDSLNVVGIDGDEGDPYTVRAILQASGVSFPQLRDPGGTVAASYGIPSGTFSVCAVGQGGKILATRIDPQGDLAAAMQEMEAEARQGLASAPVAARAGVRPQEAVQGAAGSAAAAGPSSGAVEPVPAAHSTASGGSSPRNAVIHVHDRIRFLSIDTHGTRATGGYGEELEPGNNLDLRLEVEALWRLAPGWRAGGVLRISTEGEEVLDSGPKYLGSQWGSAFVEYESTPLGARAGYYTLSMTPLTLMRWDWDDSPRTGSNVGCGCGAGAGTLLVESLDDLTPELTFEGGLLRAGSRGFELQGFYGLPHRARETSYSSHRIAGEPRARYALELYGAQARWQRADDRTGGMWRAAVHAAGAVEDRRSVDFVALGYPATEPWTENWIVTATGEVPLWRSVQLRGEVVGWNRTKTHVPSVPDGSLDSERQGNGGLLGVVVTRSATSYLKLDYLRLDPGYLATFAALTYAADNEGVRGSAQLPLPYERGLMSLFYRRTREDDPPPGVARLQSALAGIAVDLEVRGPVGASVGWIDDDAWRDGTVQPVDRRRYVLTTGLDYTFRKNGTLLLEYQHTHQEERLGDRTVLSLADLYTVQVTAAF